MTKILYMPIGGTFDPEAPEWRTRGSAFDRLANECGFERVDIDGDPGTPDESLWHRRLGGVFWQHVFGDPLDGWREGARSVIDAYVSWYHRQQAHVPVVWLAHSHGGQVAVLALVELFWTVAKHTAPPAALVSLDMPVRRTMAHHYEMLRAKHPRMPILHVHSTGRGWHDRYRMFGSRFNGCEWRQATAQMPVAGGHSRFLRDERYLPQCRDMWAWVRDHVEAAA